MMFDMANLLVFPRESISIADATGKPAQRLDGRLGVLTG
jgi:hypothetical protein